MTGILECEESALRPITAGDLLHAMSFENARLRRLVFALYNGGRACPVDNALYEEIGCGPVPS